MAQMKDDELTSAVNAELNDARAYDDSDRRPDRDMAFRYFEGEVDFPPMGPKRSKFVSKDVADTHGLILPGLMRVFFSSASIVVYEPTRPEHEAYADQASDLVNYEIMKTCNGYRQLRDGMSDGLLVGNGIMKHWWDKTPIYRTESYSGISEDEYNFLRENPDFAEEVEVEEYPDPEWVAPPPPQMPPEVMQGAHAGDPQAIAAFQQIAAQIEQAGQATAPTLYDTTLKFYKSIGRLRVEAIPNEEFLIDRTAKVLDETVTFCAHRTRQTRSDLIKEGYDRKVIDDLPRYDNDFDEARDRRTGDNAGSQLDVSSDRSTDLIEIHECYILIDYDGDGIAERRRVVLAGSQGNDRNMLANEEWGDDLPFSDIVPDPIAHEWKGRSIFDDTKDIQRVKTVAIRGILDNTYQQLLPQTDMVDGSYENPEEVMNPTFGGVRIRKSGKEMAQPVPIEYIVDKIAPVLDYMDSVGEKRTGISQRSQSLDMDALQNQSATAVNAAQSAAFSKVEEYARNIAEAGGMKRMFGCCLKLITKHQDKPKTIKLRGKWVDVDPSGWDADMDVTINTGLGTGSRERDFTLLSGVASKQEAIIQQFGPYNPKLNIGQLMETYQKMAEAGGLSNPESYFPSISQDEVAALSKQQADAANKPPSNPALDAQMQLEQLKLQNEKEMASIRDQMQQAKNAADIQLQQQKQQATLQLQAATNAAQLDLQRQKQEMELTFKQQSAELDAQLKMKEMQLEAWLTEQANLLKLRISNMADTHISGQTI